MPTPKPTTSAYGNGPKSLAKPAPKPDFDADLQSALDSLRDTEPIEAPAEGIEAEIGNAVSSLDAQAPAQAPVPAGGEFQVEADPSFMQANFTPQGAGRQLSDAWQRFRGAFTGTDREQLNDLKKQGIFADVRQDDEGNILVKRQGAKKFEKFDKKTFEILGDVIDGSRIAFESAAEGIGAAVGGISGAVAGAPAAGVGAIPGGVMGGMAGAGLTGAMANEASEMYARYGLGIERDPSRSRLKEGVLNAAFSSVLGGVGGQLARKAANQAARKEALAVSSDIVRANAKEAIEAVEEVSKAGIKLGDNGKFHLDPEQIAGKEVPEFAEMAKELSGNKQTFAQMRGARLKQQEILGNAFESMSQMIGNTTGKSVGKGNFALDANAIKDFTGKTIGSFREEAARNAGGKVQPAAQLNGYLDEVFQQIGSPAFKQTGVNKVQGTKLADSDTIRGYGIAVNDMMKELTPARAEQYAQTVLELKAGLNKAGGMTVEGMSKEYDKLTGQINSLLKSKSGEAQDLGYRLIEVKDALRNDWIEAIGKNTSPNNKHLYQQQLAKYSSTMDSFKELKNVLKNDVVGADSLAEHLFKPGMAKGDQIRAVKALYQDADPQAWRDITGQYMMKLSDKYKKGDSIDWAGFRGEIGKLSKDVQEELLDGSGLTKQSIDSLSYIGEKVSDAGLNFTATTKQKSFIKKMIYVLSNTMTGTRVDNAASIVNGMGKDRAIGVWLKEGGAEELMKQLPGGKERKWLGKFMQSYDPNMGSKKALKTAKKLSAVGARKEAQQTMQPFLGSGEPSDMSMDEEQAP